jgi:hypothetical protein
MSDIAELKRFVKSLQQASADQVRTPSRPVLSVLPLILLIFDSFGAGNRRHPASDEEGGQNHRGRS